MKCFILFTYLLLASSCVSWMQKKDVVSKSTIKLEGKNTPIRELLDIDGYYYSAPYSISSGGIIFFEDGSCVASYFKEGVSETEKQSNLANAIRTKEDALRPSWGVYTLRNDTIILHFYDKPGFLKAWDITDNRYKILSRRTMRRIYYRSILKSADAYYETHSPWLEARADTVYFMQAGPPPSSDNWLKEKKWMWRNESDWVEYMKNKK